MELAMLVFVILCISYLQVNGDEMTTAVSSDGTAVFECNFKNGTNCNMQIDMESSSASPLHWTLTKSNTNPPITDKSDPEGTFLVFHSWKIEDGVYKSTASTPELLFPTGKATLSFNYYIWDLNYPLQLEFPKLKIFACGNYTRAIWKRTGDKINKWIQSNIYLSCLETFKISFEGTINGSNCGVAIDDIVVTNGHVSTPEPTTRSPITTIPFGILTSKPKEVVTTTTLPKSNQGDDHIVWILIGIIISLIFVIFVGISVHCCIHRRNRRRRKAEMESVDADAKRKRFQETKTGLLTTSGYMTLNKPKDDVTTTADLGAIDLTISSSLKHVTATFGRGKSLPRLPSLPDEDKKQRYSLNMDATYEDVDEMPADSILSRTSQEDHGLPKNGSTLPVEATSNDQRDSAVPPVYFTLSPADQAYSHLSDYGTMPDVVKTADDNGLIYKPSLAARNIQRRKSSLSSLRGKLTKGLSNASNDYDELKNDDGYYEEVNVECQL